MSLGEWSPFDDLNFLVRQAVQFVDELVDPAVGGFDLALRAGFLL